MSAIERAVERPISTTFFPAARISFVLGLLIAFALVAWERRERAEAIVEVPVVEAPRAHVDFPLRGPAVVHVWLENCRDCMAAFEAYRSLSDQGAFAGIPEIHVSYGPSSKEFRERYRVDTNYIVDVDGAQIVRPLGIGSFTTLVIDRQGVVTMRDRPDNEGYVERVRNAWRAVR